MAALMGALYPRESRGLLRKVYRWWVKTPNTRQRNQGLSSFGVKIPSGYTIHGLDVSRYQESIDWQAVRAMSAGGIDLKFVFIKATEGATYQDAFFADNWSESKEAGLLRGAYHYYRPNVNSQTQAENFIRAVALESGDMPPILDIEELGNQSLENLQKGLKNWLQLIEKHYQIRPIIYTNRNFYKKYLQTEFKAYKFWLALYQSQDLQVESDRWLFWQHTDRALVNGVVGYADLNVFNGTWNDLQAILKPADGQKEN
jgi:lysozyme